MQFDSIHFDEIRFDAMRCNAMQLVAHTPNPPPTHPHHPDNQKYSRWVAAGLLVPLPCIKLYLEGTLQALRGVSQGKRLTGTAAAAAVAVEAVEPEPEAEAVAAISGKQQQQQQQQQQ